VEHQEVAEAHRAAVAAIEVEVEREVAEAVGQARRAA